MLPRQTDAKNPQDWFLFAEERLHGADVLWQADGLTYTGVECLQEAAERYLKGYMIGKGWALIKTHDLSRLIRDAIEIDASFKRYEDLAERLTEEFFLQHYPGLDLTGVGENYETMRHEIGEMVDYMKSVMPGYFTQSQ